MVMNSKTKTPKQGTGVRGQILTPTDEASDTNFTNEPAKPIFLAQGLQRPTQVQREAAAARILLDGPGDCHETQF